MRLLLALLAVLALLVSPVTAAAAQASCDETNQSSLAVYDMGMASVQQTETDPCCDHGATHKMDRKSCALACATSCAVSAVLPSPFVSAELSFSAARLMPARSASARPYEPSRLIRPPRSMA